MSEQIKETDIMIGNWFVGYDGKPFQWGIDQFHLIAIACDVDEIIKSPIPLTEDILLKCGFEIGGYNLMEVTHPKHTRLFLVLGNEFNSIWWNYNILGTPKDCESSQIELKYLHQLQNLFKALTQTDLKVEV